MTDPRWDRIKALLEEAQDLQGRARREFLDLRCGDDSELRREVEELLAEIDRDVNAGSEGDFLVPPSLPGQMLGDFELLQELGRGGMAIVYLARQRSLGRDVAVKVFSETPGTKPSKIERFHREARAVAKLHHPGIVQVFADGRDGEAHWFAMEYVDGHDLGLELRLQRGDAELPGEVSFFPAPGERNHAVTTARLCADVAEALEHAHQNGLVHRDVKPSNILVQADGRAQIADFGLVRDESMGSLTLPGELAGTPYYMSPEQATAHRTRVDHRTDVYSLGVVLFEMCTLRRPFEGTSSEEILNRIKRFDPPSVRRLNPGLPRDLATICEQAMAREPEARYATSQALADDLRRFMRRDPIQARPPSLRRRVLRFARCHGRLLAATAVLVLGVSLGLLWKGRTVRARLKAQLSVSALDDAGRALVGSATLRRLDPLTGLIESETNLGRLPIQNRWIVPGYFRVALRLDGFQERELTRRLDAGDKRAIEHVVLQESRTDDGETSGMIRIQGGTLSLRDPTPLLAINNKDLVIPDFWMDEHEVSNRDYRGFLEETGYDPPPHWSKVLPGEHDELPIVYVGWVDARAYAEWAGKRLPSFAEWSWAARGSAGRIYPWPNPKRGEYRGNTLQPVGYYSPEVDDVTLYLQSVAEVRSHPDARTESGLYHMLGNVSEWTESPPAEPTASGFEPRLDQRMVAGHFWNAASRPAGIHVGDVLLRRDRANVREQLHRVSVREERRAVDPCPRSTNVIFKKIVIRTSSGEGATDPVEADFQKYCDDMQECQPMIAIEFGIEKLDLAQLVLAIANKAQQVDGSTYNTTVEWATPQQHGIVPDKPDVWSKNEGANLLYEATYQVPGESAVQQYFSVSFAPDPEA